MSRTIALYPGSFDGATNGHLDIIERAAALFDQLVVAVATNRDKVPLFPVQERLEMLRAITSHLKNVEVTFFEGLTVDYAAQIGAKFIIRGLRAVSDFEYELQIALTNHRMNDSIETIFMVPSARFSFISSSTVKAVAELGGDISDFVPPAVEKKFKKIYGSQGE
jgi:pantetheine-phosphate adenylyltransferase